MESSGRLRRMGAAGETFLREQLEASSKEIKQLKAKMEQLEQENTSLKKSVYALSWRVKSDSANAAGSSNYYDLDSFDDIPPSILEILTSSTSNPSFVPSSRDTPGKDPRLLHPRHDLRGHTGAVYAVQFSPCGRFVASGSFDKTVRIWDSMTPTELKRFEKHTLCVSDVSWSSDSSMLLSGGLDGTCTLWDVEAGKPISTHRVDGFVQCCLLSTVDSNIFFCGTSRKSLCMFDRRSGAGAAPQVTHNDSPVNTMYLSMDGAHAITGDGGGAVKTWDVRVGRAVHWFYNENGRKPISHVHASRRANDEDEPPMLAVNSYDNVLRVYDRSTIRPPTPGSVAIAATPAPAPKHALAGIRNQNFPIRSSFFRGQDHVYALPGRSTLSPSSSADLDDVRNPLRTTENSLLLATGSADSHAYVYDLSGSDGGSQLLQQLDGHTDRVYTTAFHPTRPLLATGSADFTVKLWMAKTQKPQGRQHQFVEWADQ